MVHEGRGSLAQVLLSHENLVVAFKIFLIVTPHTANHKFSLEQLKSVKCASLCTQNTTPTFTCDHLIVEIMRKKKVVTVEKSGGGYMSSFRPKP